MNMKIPFNIGAFDPVKKTVIDHIAAVKKHCLTYQNTVDQAKIFADHIQQQKTEAAKVQLKMSLISENERFKADYDAAIQALSGKLTETITASTVPDGLLNQISTMKTLGIRPSRRELEAMVEGANGSYMGIRAVAELAKGSGFKVDFLSPDDLESDLKEVRMICHESEFYAPRECETLISGLLGVESWLTHYQSTVALESTDKIAAVADRWATLHHAYVVQWSDADEQVEQATIKARTVAVNPDYVQQAYETTAQQEAETARIMQHYIKGGVSNDG